MGYLNGREPAKGDMIIGLDLAGNAVTGIVMKVCDPNGGSLLVVAPFFPALSVPVSCRDCLHADDLPRAGDSRVDAEITTLEEEAMQFAMDGNLREFHARLSRLKLIFAARGVGK